MSFGAHCVYNLCRIFGKLVTGNRMLLLLPWIVFPSIFCHSLRDVSSQLLYLAHLRVENSAGIITTISRWMKYCLQNKSGGLSHSTLSKQEEFNSEISIRLCFFSAIRNNKFNIRNSGSLSSLFFNVHWIKKSPCFYDGRLKIFVVSSMWRRRCICSNWISNAVHGAFMLKQ